MNENWLNENLCSFDEKVRIELGPQIVELDCTIGNLSDEVTFPHYKIGGIDALGRIIMPERCTEMTNADIDNGIVEGDKMMCVDWREKHLPKVWKIYVFDEAESKFIQQGEEVDRDKAISIAHKLAGEM